MFGQLSDGGQAVAGLQAVGTDEMFDLIGGGIPPIGAGADFLRSLNVQYRRHVKSLRLETIGLPLPCDKINHSQISP
jgi:hypothetical protein